MRELTAPIACLALIAPTAVIAQNVATPPQDSQKPPSGDGVGTEDEDTGASGDIVVTAQRREERLRDVPISISVVTADRIASAGLLSTRDLQQVTPGIVTQNSGFQFRPTIRGIGGFAGGGSGDEQNVAIYVDNVYQSSPGANAFNLMNIERIEVLKGPQGTLFGRNATGGAIRIITSDPGSEPALRGMVSYGPRLDATEVSAYGETGIAPGLAVSLNGYFYNDGGYVRNINPAWNGGKLARVRSFNIRGKLLLQPTPDLKAVVGFERSKTRSSQELTTVPQQGLLGFRNVAGVVVATEPLTTSLDFEGFQRSNSTTAFATVTWDLGRFGLESTTSTRRVELSYNFDVDRTNLPLTISFADGIQNVTTQEVIGSTKFGGPFNLIVGYFYYNAGAKTPYSGLSSAPLSAVANGVRTVLGPPVVTSNTGAFVNTTSNAVFGEANLDIGRLTLIGGLRYTSESKTASVSNLLNVALGPSNGKLSFDNVSYRATARFKYNDTGMIYLTRSTGFKSGQFNGSVRTVPLTTVRPETLGAWEIGLKDRPLSWLDVTLAAFDYKYNDIQLTVFNTFNPALGTNILLNAASAKTRGGELQADARLGGSARANLGVSYLPVAQYSRFPNAIDYVPRADGLGATQLVTDLSGARMPYSPRWTANFGLGKTIDLGGGKFDLDANGYYKTRFEWIPGHRFGQPSLFILNATATWRAPNDKYNIGVFGRNLTDRKYLTSGGATTAGFSGAYARPREIGARFGFNF